MIKKIQLRDDEFLQSHISSINAGITLIRSCTGTGKSTLVLDGLAKQQLVLMLVPLVGQITQLASTYKGRNDICFAYGAKKVRKQDVHGKSIVCTYDLYPMIRDFIVDDIDNYLLVVDEVHKLYSAGSYRSEAINPVLGAVTSRKHFSGRLLLTATYTDAMGNLAKWQPDTDILVSKTGLIKRSLVVRAYSKSSPVNWLSGVISRLEARVDGKGIVFVRLNSGARIDRAMKLLKDKGWKCLKVSRKNSHEDAVKGVLTNEKLPAGIDVVFTTSILDEAINLRNEEGVIDSVHIVDRVAHPEEVVQFLGRLRDASPTAFLHVNDDDGTFRKPRDTAKDTGSDARRAWAVHNYISTTADSAKKMVLDAKRLGLDGDIRKYADDLNITFERFASTALLQIRGEGKDVDVYPNRAGILAATYRADLSAAYESHEALKHRLLELLPTLTVSLEEVPEQEVKEIIERLKVIEADEEVTRHQVGEAVVEKLIDLYAESNKTSLREYADAMLKESEEELYYGNPYSKADDREHHDGFYQSLKLAQILVDPEDIQDVLQAGKYYEILNRQKGFNDEIEYCFRSVLEAHCETAPLEDEGVKLTLADCEKIGRRAFALALKRFPAIDDAVKDRRCFSKLFTYSKDGKLVVSKSKAANLILTIASCKDVNAKKKDRRYLIVQDLSPMAYRYHKLDPLKPEELRDTTIPLESVFDDAA